MAALARSTLIVDLHLILARSDQSYAAVPERRLCGWKVQLHRWEPEPDDKRKEVMPVEPNKRLA